MLQRRVKSSMLALISAISLSAFALAPHTASALYFNAAGWSGGVTYAESTGGFNGCFVTETGKGGSRVVLFWRKDGLAVAVFDPQWDLGVENTSEISMAVDGRWKTAASGTAIGRHAIHAALGQDEAPLTALKRGNNFEVSAEGAEYSFPLKGSSKAIAFLQACYAANS